MRGFFIRATEILSWIMVVIFIVVGALAGASDQGPLMAPGMGFDLGSRIVGLVVGGIVGLLTSVLVVGMLFLLIDIREQTRKTALLLEQRLNTPPRG